LFLKPYNFYPNNVDLLKESKARKPTNVDISANKHVTKTVFKSNPDSKQSYK